MNISLDRLIEGIIVTLRGDVIPNISDAYARGQAVGVIDILNNIGPRIEWSRAPVVEALKEKLALLEQLQKLLPGQMDAAQAAIAAESSTEQLSRENARLDAIICDTLATIHRSDPVEPRQAEALGLIKTMLHDEQTRQMKSTRKPLFAEIAAGASKPATATGEGRS